MHYYIRKKYFNIIKRSNMTINYITFSVGKRAVSGHSPPLGCDIFFVLAFTVSAHYDILDFNDFSQSVTFSSSR